MKNITLTYAGFNEMYTVILSSKTLRKMLNNLGQTYLIYTEDLAKKDQMLKVEIQNVQILQGIDPGIDLYMGYIMQPILNEPVLCIMNPMGGYHVIYDCNYQNYQEMRNKLIIAKDEKDRLNEKIKELENTIIELKYRPGGIGYQEAKEHYESFIV